MPIALPCLLIDPALAYGLATHLKHISSSFVSRSSLEDVSTLDQAIERLVQHKRVASGEPADTLAATPAQSGASGALTKRTSILTSEPTSSMSNLSLRRDAAAAQPRRRETGGGGDDAADAGTTGARASAAAAAPSLAQLCREVTAEGGAMRERAAPASGTAPLMQQLLHALVADCSDDGAASLPLADVFVAFKARASVAPAARLQQHLRLN